MPYSSKSGKEWSKRIIKRLIKICTNNSIIDIGAGEGTYATMLRPELPSTAFTGVEIWEPLLEKYALSEKYENIIIEDVRTFTTEQTYGISIFGDVLEHMTKQEAIDVFNKVLKFSEFVLISIPIVRYPQDELWGNPYEKHIKDDWNHEEVLGTFSNIALFYTENEIGVYVAFNPALHSKEEVIKQNEPKIAVYAIYKNEGKFIERSLNSVKNVDEIVLCDTGCVDDTNAIIDSFKENNPETALKVYKIFVDPWRFDDARNAAMSLVSKDIDICISLDMDEYLMEGWRDVLVARWKPKFTWYNHMFKNIWSKDSTSSHWHCRIHKRRGYTWKLAVHEVLEYKGEENTCWIDNLWIFHEPDTSKSRSYLPLLEKSSEERPDVWRTWSYLANEYLAAGRFEEMSSAADKALALEDSDKGYLHMCKYYMYRRQNKQDLALLSLNNYIFFQSSRREPYFLKADYLHQIGRNIEAYFTLLDAQKHTNEIFDYHRNVGCWGNKFDEFLIKVEEAAKKEGLKI